MLLFITSLILLGILALAFKWFIVIFDIAVCF